MKGNIRVCFHVDDLLIAAVNDEALLDFQDEFKKHFDVKTQNGGAGLPRNSSAS